MKTHYEHYSRVPPKDWHWPSFSPSEIACKGTGKLLIDTDAMDRLQALRDRLGKPVIITSAYRSPEHNKRVGGAKSSKHMDGIAFDVRMDNHDPHAFEAAARAVGFTGFGYYIKSGFMHIDTGPERSWGTPWPVTATAWPTEPPRQAESLKDDTEAQAAAGAGVAGLVATGAEYLPAAEGILGRLAPTAQLIAVSAGALFIGYLLWKRTR
ncbi:YcbK family protein [Yoonia sp.]|uniref:YcbK family protein n=1 Tax=Yoonia sp. TaxID=2212373 RepID=UPI002E08CDCB|nr:D-Ala-D-Ala carboxypeptidase family metallohydrolase [Yoonia sp.]